MHTLSVSLRMMEGELPHLDFMTPIGILGFAPIVGWFSHGYQLGKAILLADITVAALLIPAVWWVGTTRLTMKQSIFLGTMIVVITTALVYGDGSTTISLAMNYNRWAWSIAFVVLSVVLFPAKVDLAEPWIASIIIGVGMVALAMMKMTYFVAIAPAILLILVVQKQYILALTTSLTGLGVSIICVTVLGFDFFFAYFRDLLSVMAQDSGRAIPLDSFSKILFGPSQLSGTIVLIGSFLVFRKSGYLTQGLVILFLIPVFSYITYQNWGNDPVWLIMVILYLWVNLPNEGQMGVFQFSARQSVFAIICVACTAIFPSSASFIWSPIRSLLFQPQGFTRILNPASASDIWLPESRMVNVAVRRNLEGTALLVPAKTQLEIGDYVFPDCSSGETTIPLASAMAQQVEALDFTSDKPILTADKLDISWMFGEIERVQGAAPWYYGDTAGIENADYLMVPICPIDVDLRRQMVSQLNAAKFNLNEVYRSNLLVLYEVSKPTE